MNIEIDRYYRIRNRHSGKYLHVFQASKKNYVGFPALKIAPPIPPVGPGVISQWDYDQRGVDYDDHFLFLLIPAPDRPDSYYIFNKRSGRGWHVPDAYMDNGGVIAQWDYRDRRVEFDDHFIFKLKQVEKAFYIKNKRSGKYLHVYQASMDNGGNIAQWDHGDRGVDFDDHFMFELRPVKNQAHNASDIENVPLYIVNARSGKYLHVVGASTDNGGNIAQWDHERTGVDLDDHFIFELKRVDDAYYIVNKLSGKYLHVVEASMDNGGNIAQWDHEDKRVHFDDHFMFVLEPANDAFHIENARSRKHLHVFEASMENGGIISQWDYGDRGVDFDDHFIFEFQINEDEKITMPSLEEVGGDPSKQIPDPKEFDENLPKKSTPALQAQELYPFIFVKDEFYLKPSAQLKNQPYYLLRKEGLYKRAGDRRFDLDSKLLQKEKTKVTLTRSDTVTITETFGWSLEVKGSAGIKIKKVISASGEVSKKWHEEVMKAHETSTTENYETEVAYEVSHKPTDVRFRVVTWVYCDRYTLTRADGTKFLTWETVHEGDTVQRKYKENEFD